METALVHFDSEQKSKLSRRARRRGTSFSQEVRNAVDLYLELPPEEHEELAALATAANHAADHAIEQLDQAIAAVRRVTRQKRARR